MLRSQRYGNFSSGSGVNRGTPTGAPLDDIDGNPRDTRPDVGPHEYVAPECDGVSCSDHGICEPDLADGIVCGCDPGYARPPQNDLACEEVNECATGNGGCDPP